MNAEIDDGSELAGLMKYFRESDPEDMSQGELSKRVHYLKEEEGGEEIMCEMSEKWWREGREDKAKETSIRLSRMGMPAEKIAEAVQYSVTLVQQWIGQAARS